MSSYRKVSASIKVLASIICFLWIGINESKGIQIKEVGADAEIEVSIARGELNRIKVEGDRIRCIKSNEGEVEVVEDSKLGEIYIKPIKRANINTFITTQKDNTYQVKLLPKEIDSQQIVLKNTKSDYKDKDYKDKVVRFIRRMAEEGEGSYEEEGMIGEAYKNYEDLSAKELGIKHKAEGAGVAGEIAYIVKVIK